MKKTKFVIVLLLVTVGVIMIGAVGLSGQSAKKKRVYTYKESYTPEGRIKAGLSVRAPYSKDLHMWVYKSSFAKRFGMPEEWIDDS